jgi:hypothetical protein
MAKQPQQYAWQRWMAHPTMRAALRVCVANEATREWLIKYGYKRRVTQSAQQKNNGRKASA